MSTNITRPNALYEQGVIESKMLHQLLRIIWSVVCFVGGAYLIEKMTVTEPVISSVVLPIYFILVLAALYMGHLLIDAISGESSLIITWLPTVNKISSSEEWSMSSSGSGFALATVAIALVTSAPIETNQSRVRGTIEAYRSQPVVQSPYFVVLPKA